MLPPRRLCQAADPRPDSAGFASPRRGDRLDDRPVRPRSERRRSLFGVIGRRAIGPILSGRREDINVDRVFQKREFVRNIGRDDHDIARLHNVLAPLRIHLGGALRDPRNLLIDVVMKRHKAAFLCRPLHEGSIVSAEILPLQQLRNLLDRLCVEFVELGRYRAVRTDIGQDAAARSVMNLREQHRGHRCVRSDHRGLGLCHFRLANDRVIKHVMGD
jgi:hypothetical protein